jgi:methanogenic corrinoid protein MtbC1
MPAMAENRDLHKRLMAEALSERFGLALLEGETSAAEEVVRDAYDAGLPQAVIHDAVVAPAMYRIGALWERGEIGVAHEHMATQTSLRVLALLRELYRVARGRRDQRVMLAAVQGEHHVVGLEMAASLLEEAGYDVVMLGPDVPTDALEDIVGEHRPEIVALSVTMASAAANLPRAVAGVATAHSGAGVIVGGARGRTRLPDPASMVFADSVAGVVETADALVRRPGLN